MTVALRAETTSDPALLLRPWNKSDLAALVEVYRDPVLRRWTMRQVDNLDDAVRWRLS